jgi:hypothetical protein
MSTTNLSELIYEPVNEQYGWGLYGEFRVLIRRKDGYVNVTKLCKDGGKKLFHWSENEMSRVLVGETSQVLGIPSTQILEVYQAGSNYELSGTYAHPHLVPHIASWISPEFAVKVSRIVNDHLVREYKEQIREKTDKIDELMKKLDDQNLVWNSKFDRQNKQMETQSKDIARLTSINLNQTSILEDQRRMLQVVNENVIESVSALHHVSDKSVPYERLKDELTEQLVIVNTEEDKYAAVAFGDVARRATGAE